MRPIVTFRGCGFVMAAELAEAHVLEARLACAGRLWRNRRKKQSLGLS